MKLLLEKTIVIVGGTSGIGLSAAKACQRQGAALIIVGRDDDDTDGTFRRAAIALTQASSAGGMIRPSWIRGDAVDPDTSRHAIDEAVRRFGRLDGLFHVAGGSGRRFGDGPLHELTDEGITTTLEHNLTSVLLSNRAAVRCFLRQGSGGSVVNLASVLARHPSPKYFATITYAAAKAGVIGATRSAAAAYARDDIRFNVIAPGLVDTPMARRAVQDQAIVDFASRKQPLGGGRIGRPEDSDGAAVFLLSDQADFITGQVLAVDGGWNVSEGNE